MNHNMRALEKDETLKGICTFCSTNMYRTSSVSRLESRLLAMPRNRTTHTSAARSGAPRHVQGRGHGRVRECGSASIEGPMASSYQLCSAQEVLRQPPLRTSWVGDSDKLQAMIWEEIRASLGAMTLPAAPTLLPWGTHLQSLHSAPPAIPSHTSPTPIPGYEESISAIHHYANKVLQHHDTYKTNKLERWIKEGKGQRTMKSEQQSPKERKRKHWDSLLKDNIAEIP